MRLVVWWLSWVSPSNTVLVPNLRSVIFYIVGFLENEFACQRKSRAAILMWSTHIPRLTGWCHDCAMLHTRQLDLRFKSVCLDITLGEGSFEATREDYHSVWRQKGWHLLPTGVGVDFTHRCYLVDIKHQTIQVSCTKCYEGARRTHNASWHCSFENSPDLGKGGFAVIVRPWSHDAGECFSMIQKPLVANGVLQQCSESVKDFGRYTGAGAISCRFWWTPPPPPS